MPYWLPPLLVAPSLLWLARDRSVWPWDQAWYGAGSVGLFYTLLQAPALWLREMLAVVEAHSPGVVWLGQAFVPAGLLLRSVDDGLLLSILATNAVAVLLVHRSILELSGQRQAVAAAASLAVASAPMFVGLSHQYLTEPLQLLAVAWFVFIMCAAPRWSAAFTLAQLAAATAVALAAKVSSPVYCAGPGLVAIGHARAKGWPLSPRSWREPRAAITAAAAVVLLSVIAAWYWRNLEHVRHHVAASMSGPHAEIYGRNEAFLPAVMDRARTLMAAFFRPFAVAGLALIVAAGAVWRRRPGPLSARFRAGAITSAVQVVAVVAILALSPNREARYLLALLPYCALLAAWALWRANRRLLVAAAVFVLGVQLIVSHAHSLGILRPRVYSSPWVLTPRHEPREAAILEELAWRTCLGGAPRPRRHWNVVGIELPWLNKNSAAYAAAKVLGPRGLVGCNYDSMFNFTVTDPDALWALVQKADVRYYVAKRSGLSAVPADDAHLVAVNRNTLAVLDRVRASGQFAEEAPLARDPDILVLRRVGPGSYRTQ